MANRKGTLVIPDTSPRRQKGIAALLLVLLTGLSATVVALGTMSYVRGSQKSQMTVHAQTQSEINAWAGVQALTTYLNNTLNANPNTALSAYLNSFGTLTFSKTANNVNTAIATADYQTNCSNPNATNAVACFNVTGTSANSNVTLQVAYRITQPNSPPPLQAIANPVVFNGNLTISGGGLDVTGDTELRNIAVNGDLTMESAATSEISGCATGDITINGGGISDHGHLYSSGGNVDIDGQQVTGISVWGANVTVTGGGGSYQAVKANGDITITGAGIDIVEFMHADNIVTTPGGHFTDVKVHGDYLLGNGGPPHRQFGTLTGGGDFIVSSSHHLPIFDQPSTIAGRIRVGSSDGEVYSDPIHNLSVNRLQAAPGLPGLPECEIDVTAFDVNDLIDQANYVFYFHEQSGDPMLKIQHVTNKHGDSVDRTINLKETDVRTLGGLDFMQCGWHATGPACVQSANAADGWEFTGLFAFPPGIVLFGGTGDPDMKNLTATRFTLNGISDGESSPLYNIPLYNTLLSTGDLTLTTGGRNLRALTAPNFGDVANVCDRDFHPSQLCDKSSEASAIETIVDSDGNTIPKYPLANNAVMTNQDFSTNSWAISGHVVVGDDIETGAGLTTIEGGLSVGLNVDPDDEDQGDTAVSAGGLNVNISTLTSGQLLTSQGGTATGNTGGAGASQRLLTDYQVRAL